MKQCSVKKDKTLLNTKWSHSKDETRLEKLFKCLKFRLFDEARLKRRLQSTLQFPQAMDVVEEKEKGTVGDDDDVLTTAHTDGKSDVGVDVSLILSRVSAIKALEELEIELKSCFIT